MKKLFLLLPCLLLTACPYSIYEMVNGKIPEPKEISNPECDVDGNMKVIQVIDNKSTLLSTSTGDYENDKYIFYAEVPKGNTTKELFDDAIFSTDGYCFKIDGTYQYTSIVGTTNTIRKLKPIKSTIPNPEYK